jgi:tRNA(Ile)-lysidine synthase
MENSLKDRFLEFLINERLCQPGDQILLTVSGGADSMVMADLFHQSGFRFAIAHCNFQLRGEESSRDEKFVSEYARRLGTPCHIIRFNTADYAREHKQSIQEAARTLRYDWFEQVRQQEGYTFTATAHHLNDRVETLLLHFFKGTGIHGLAGIPVKNGKVIRPLLFLTKAEILRYAADRGLSFVEDSSNASEKYSRNYLRHRIIPLIEEAFPGLDMRLGRNMQRFGEAVQLYDQAIDSHRKKLVKMAGEEARISILQLKKSRPLRTIAYEIFKPWGFSADQSRQIIAMLDGTPGLVIYSAHYRLIRDRKWLIITPKDSPTPSILQISEDQSRVAGNGFSLTIRRVPAAAHTLSRRKEVASLDAAKIRFPLLLRRWRQGDYFYPLGMPKKKKLSRFFIDQKLSLAEKEKIWVLESEKRIIWVVGLRIDDRFKIRAATTEVLEVTYTSSPKS